MKIFLAALSGLIFFSGCYTFSGISLAPEVRTYWVGKFENNSVSSAPNLEVQFAEALRDKVRLESRLKYDENDPHVEFSGAIQDFRVSTEAPLPGETSAFNRLTISVQINYRNNVEDKEWQRSFSFFSNFPAEQDILSVQDQLITTINRQLVEDIFNAAFTDW